MFFFPFIPDKIEDPEIAFVYIEKKVGDRILIDFLDSFEFGRFSNLIGVPNDWQENGSMIEFINYRGERKIQKGVVYILNLKALLNLDIAAFISQVESLVLAYQIDLADINQEIFGTSIALSKLERERGGISNRFTPSINDLKIESFTDQVVIRKIGQGNWNELYDKEKVHTVFDAGTIYTTSRNNLIRLIDDRDKLYQVSKPIFILSHWDVDHYHFLLGMEDDTIKAFQKFVFRNKVPSLTARKIIGRFNLLNKAALFPINADPRPKYTRGPIRLSSYPYNYSGTLQLLNAQENRSRNKSGIGLLLRTKNNTVVFAGDFYYDQLDIDVLPLISYQHDNHYLIVPHHGGNAGRMIYRLRTLVIQKKGIISVGKNPYIPKHPYSTTISSLMNLGFSVTRTDLQKSDYIIKVI